MERAWRTHEDRQRPYRSTPRQAIELLGKPKEGSKGAFLFPSPAGQKTPHLHRDALSKALREMDFQGKHATYGFRGTLRTMSRGCVGVDIDILEVQLAHAKRGDVQKAYDRSTFGTQRITAMHAWADYLEKLCKDT